jgi:tetratricopeptide (TPR) repeat protein
VESVVVELNETTAADRGLRLEVSRWETDAYAGFHVEGAQGICDAVLKIEDADLLVGIFWSRFGTGTADGRAGTEHEIAKALASWRKSGRPQIMLFFSNKPPALRTSAERRQWLQVAEYREQLADGLLWEYSDPPGFKKEFRTCLINYLGDQFPQRLEHMPNADRLDVRPCFVRRYWNLNARRNPLFTGRAQVLNDLHRALQSRAAAALTGIGGVGKTQTAIEYAWRHRDDYRAVFWTEAANIRAGYAGIAASLNLPSANETEQDRAVAEARHWFEQNSGWLLIVDNADELASVQPLLPNTDGNRHLILTTRDEAVNAIAQRIHVRSMPPDEGASFLLSRANIPSPTEADRAASEKLSKELGGLPLALDQAGAFVEESRLTIAEYASLYETEKQILLSERGKLGDHPSVAVTFTLAFEKLRATNPEAADIVRVCAFLAPEDIPEAIFTQGAEPNDRLAFSTAVKGACRFALLDRNRDNQTLTIHRLVQIVIQLGMSGTDQKTWAERTIRVINEAFPIPAFPNWQLCQQLLSHARVCACLIDQWNLGLPEAGRLLNRAGLYVHRRGLYAEAESLLKRALAIRENALGPSDTDVAQTLNNLGDVYRSQERYAEAAPLYHRSLAIREAVLGSDHPEVAGSLNNAAAILRSEGRYAEAEALYRRSLVIRSRSYGKDHHLVALNLNHLAELYYMQGKYAEAEPLFQRALSLREKLLDPHHPDIAATLHGIASLLRDQRRYAEAEPLYQRALTIREKALSPHHPDTRRTRENLATIRSKLP